MVRSYKPPINPDPGSLTTRLQPGGVVVIAVVPDFGLEFHTTQPFTVTPLQNEVRRRRGRGPGLIATIIVVVRIRIPLHPYLYLFWPFLYLKIMLKFGNQRTCPCMKSWQPLWNLYQGP